MLVWRINEVDKGKERVGAVVFPLGEGGPLFICLRGCHAGIRGRHSIHIPSVSPCEVVAVFYTTIQ